MTESEEVRRQYECERRLADRIRRAPRSQRRGVYSEVYEEFFRQFPLLAGDPAGSGAREFQVELELRLLEPYLSSADSMIEFGAGDGALASAASARVGRIWAVDAAARQEGAGLVPCEPGPGELRWLRTDGPPLPLPDGCCDLAYSCHFVEHLHPEDLADHLAEAHRLLGVTGRYVCVTPNRLLGPHDVSKYFTPVATGLHLREYSHRELVDGFRDAGFRRVEILREIGQPATEIATRRQLRLERLVAAIPRSIRLALLSSPLWKRSEPFRPFEQVKVVASK